MTQSVSLRPDSRPNPNGDCHGRGVPLLAIGGLLLAWPWMHAAPVCVANQETPAGRQPIEEVLVTTRPNRPDPDTQPKLSIRFSDFEIPLSQPVIDGFPPALRNGHTTGNETFTPIAHCVETECARQSTADGPQGVGGVDARSPAFGSFFESADPNRSQAPLHADFSLEIQQRWCIPPWCSPYPCPPCLLPTCPDPCPNCATVPPIETDGFPANIGPFHFPTDPGSLP